MASLNPYLNFDGETEAAFKFYKSVFGGEFQTISRYGEIPEMPGVTISEEERKLIMHVSLPIGKNAILMGSDISKSIGHSLKVGNNYYITIQPESKEEAGQLFNGLSAGGKVMQPLEDTLWGAYFGMFIDKFGVQWMVNYSHPQQ